MSDPGSSPPATTQPRPESGDRRRIRVIWNARAGHKVPVSANEVNEARLRQVMARAHLGDELVATRTPDEAREQAADAVRRGYDLVVAAGGDGTVDVVAEQLLDRTTALGILPLGTVMNVARSLGLPRDLDAAADVIAGGVVKPIDVGEVRGRPFFEAASVGMNAAMFREAQRFEQGDLLSIVRTIWVAFRYRPARMSIELDDRRIQTRALMVTVSNGPYTGAALTVAPEARLDDGKFDVRVFRRFSKLRLIRHLISIAFGRYRFAPEIDTARSSVVRIDSATPLPARADSRDLGSTPVELRVRPGALRAVVPPPTDRRGGAPTG
ncbi:MAG TPA: diacylglycerol kinase family protein [Candidatus Limnocylindrales bacterium]|nr:diacylglycerol kinase family protein [Candidatus Limnocylindrales bacterium]